MQHKFAGQSDNPEKNSNACMFHVSILDDCILKVVASFDVRGGSLRTCGPFAPEDISKSLFAIVAS